MSNGNAAYLRDLLGAQSCLMAAASRADDVEVSTELREMGFDIASMIADAVRKRCEIVDCTERPVTS